MKQRGRFSGPLNAYLGEPSPCFTEIGLDEKDDNRNEKCSGEFVYSPEHFMFINQKL